MYYLVLVGSSRYHGSEPLTYMAEQALPIGTVVRVPLGKQETTGIIIAKAPKPAFPTKPISFARPDAILPATSLNMLKWLQAYYPAPLGQTVELFTPPSLSQGKDPREPYEPFIPASQPPTLTDAQQNAFNTIQAHPNSSVLLQGVTGSGKTRLYLELADRLLAAKKSVLVLTPEIGLTRPLADQFKQHRTEEVIIQHSAMTPAERRKQWLRVAQASQPVIVIGARSALFLPFQSLGLIVVDEAHDSAYKQSQSPRYHSLRVAGKLRELHKARLVLGTATPLISERYQFESRQLPIITLDTQAIVHDTQRNTVVIDSRNRGLFSRSAYLSNQLITATSKALEAGEQTLLFLNKRGSARLVLCQACGWQASCQRCDTALTFHADSHNLRCHSCDTAEIVPTNCPACGHVEILFKSIGTKALEQEVQRLFPGAKVARFDSDTEKAASLVARSHELLDGQIDIIIGTQTVTKGFDLTGLGVVGIVQADTSLAIPDFTAQERTFQLINQVSGRIGRGHRDGTLVVQTYNPDNPVIQQAINNQYDIFYADELRERQRFHFPPFVHIMTVSCSRATRQSATSACEKLKQQLLQDNNGIQVDGPAPRFIEKPRGKYAWHLVIRSANRSKLTTIASQLPTGWTHDLDPIDLL